MLQKHFKEIKYHLRHSREWVLRLGDGTEESHRRIQDAIDEIWMYTDELFNWMILIKQQYHLIYTPIRLHSKRSGEHWFLIRLKRQHCRNLTMISICLRGQEEAAIPNI